MSAEQVPSVEPKPEEFLLIDLSSIAYPLWHTSQSEPNPDATSIKTVERVRALASGHQRVAVCVDSGKSFRSEVDPSYKAQRPAQDETLRHQIKLAIETLQRDGFPVWGVKGYEADDVIATAAARALERPGATVVIATGDKDLLALVSPRTSVKSTRDGTVYDEAAVLAKFGVKPCQMRDYLTLVGDSSDNIRGAKGIGPKKAAELLRTFIELDMAYQCIDDQTGKFQPAILNALLELRPRLPTVRALVDMKTDVPIPFEEILAARVPQEASFAPMEEDEMESQEVQPRTEQPPASEQIILVEPARPAEPKPTTAGNVTSLAPREDVLAPAPAEWERQLDPRSMKEVRMLAQDMFTSRMFSAYGTPQAVLSTILVGRELGLPAMGSLRNIHVVEGRHTLSAALMVALVLRSGLAEFFEPVEFDEKHAIFKTHRKGARKPVKLEHTIEMAQTAGLVKPNSNWVKTPVDMLCARAQSRLARMVYPDLLAGLYTKEEIEDMRGAA